MLTKTSQYRCWISALALAGLVFFAGATPGQAGCGKLCPSIVLYSFTGGVDGANPNSALIRDSAGNLYGTTAAGGGAGYGLVFKLDNAGNFSVLHSFSGGSDGAQPSGGLILDSAGNLYGTAYAGGGNGVMCTTCGIVFKLDPSENLTVLHAFTGGADGGNPSGGVSQDSAGNLYGTTEYGGDVVANAGVIFKLDSTGNYTVLYNFTGGDDGANPLGRVTGDSAGNLYGTASNTTTLNGSGLMGVLFTLDTAGKFTVLHSFPGCGSTCTAGDGLHPDGGVLRVGGNLFATTYDSIPSLGGSSLGTLFTYGYGNFSYLHSFGNLSNDGYHPNASIAVDYAGNLYGTTQDGPSLTPDAGVVFKLDLLGNYTVLYTFSGGADGNHPYAGVIHSGSTLYGTTKFGGTYSFGVVFAIPDH